jgi:hypothetical protein
MTKYLVVPGIMPSILLRDRFVFISKADMVITIAGISRHAAGHSYKLVEFAWPDFFIHLPGNKYSCDLQALFCPCRYGCIRRFTYLQCPILWETVLKIILNSYKL